MSDDIHFTLRKDVSFVNAVGWPDSGGCNVLCITDRQLSILRQMVWPRCLFDDSFVVPVFDKWYTYPVAALQAEYNAEVQSLIDKLGKGASVDCQNLQTSLDLLVQAQAPYTSLLLYSSNLALPAGATSHEFLVVADDQSIIMDTIVVQYIGTAPNSLRLLVLRSGVYYVMGEILTPVSGRHYTWTGPFYLQPNDTMQVRIFNATLNDDIHVHSNGRIITHQAIA